MEESFEREIIRCETDDVPVSLIMIDIDNFKTFNDQFGHLAGDRALSAVANILQHQFRPRDLLVRYGGDEFAVLLPEVNEELAYVVTEPGVSFFDLYRYFQEHGQRMWMSVPGPGWGSIIGNGMDGGIGYGYYSDHFASSAGLEIVLANGELMRTGMGAMSNSPCSKLKRGPHQCGASSTSCRPSL